MASVVVPRHVRSSRPGVLGLYNNRLSLDRHLVWLDAWAFEEFLARSPQPSRDGVGENVEEAMELYEGPFLADHADLDWAWPMRERLRSAFVPRLLRHGRQLTEARQLERAMAVFEKAIAVDPLAEEGYRALMRGHQALGRGAEALVVYEKCRTVLRSALETDPAPETVALYESIKNAATRAARSKSRPT
jgi:LuxR family maltose regulon positive regulatory protein